MTRMVAAIDLGSTHSGVAVLEDVPNALPSIVKTLNVVTAAREECSARARGKETSRGRQRSDVIDAVFFLLPDLMRVRWVKVKELTVVVERCPVTARTDSGRSGSQALIGWALGRTAGMWEYATIEHGYLYDEIEVGPTVRRGGKRVKGGWRSVFPLLKGMSEIELVALLWPGSNVTSEHVAAAVLIGAAYLMGGNQ